MMNHTDPVRRRCCIIYYEKADAYYGKVYAQVKSFHEEGDKFKTASGRLWSRVSYPVVQAIYNQAGLEPSNERPLRQIDHTMYLPALTGSANAVRDWTPGEVSLAHGGSLWLENINLYSPAFVKRLCVIWKSGEVVVRAKSRDIVVPAIFDLIIVQEDPEASIPGCIQAITTDVISRNKRISRRLTT